MANEGLFMDAEGNVKDAWGRPAELEEEDEADGTDANGDGTVSYDEMTADALKAEVKRRQDEGRELDLSDVKRKADLVAVLVADDEAQARGE